VEFKNKKTKKKIVVFNIIFFFFFFLILLKKNYGHFCLFASFGAIGKLIIFFAVCENIVSIEKFGGIYILSIG